MAAAASAVSASVACVARGAGGGGSGGRTGIDWGVGGRGGLAPTKESVGIRLPSEAGVRLRRRRGGGIGC